MKPIPASRGFSLLEALIAMAVISIALLAIAKNSSGQIHQIESLRQTTLAAWVADNIVTETRLGLNSAHTGTSAGVRRMGEQDWAWTMNSQASPDPEILRLDVVVRGTGPDGSTNVQHTGFARADLH